MKNLFLILKKYRNPTPDSVYAMGDLALILRRWKVYWLSDFLLKKIRSLGYHLTDRQPIYHKGERKIDFAPCLGNGIKTILKDNTLIIDGMLEHKDRRNERIYAIL